MAQKRMFLIVAVSLLVQTVVGQSAPNFCTYIEDHVYTCDYASMVTTSDRPIAFADFGTTPQQIDISVNGFFPYFGDTQVFSSDFGTIDQTQFDPNYASTLTIDCGYQGSIFFSGGSLSNMSHVQKLKIRGCQTLYIPSMAFQELVDLDSFSFELGYLDDVDPGAMFGLSVEKLTSGTHAIPRNIGRFEALYTKFQNKYVPPGLLFAWKNLTSAALVGADLETIGGDVFTYNTKIRYIDISENPFTSIPDSIFDGLDSLAEVRMYNIPWQCSCTNAWFVGFAASNNITLLGDMMCGNADGTTVYKYYYDNCLETDLCAGTLGVGLMNKCLTMFAMIAYSCAFVSLVLCIVSLGLIICARKQEAQKKVRRVKARGRWNKVLDVNIKSKMKK